MNNTTLLALGEYNENQFYLYTIDKKNYYAVKDIDCLFMNGQLNTKTVMLHELFAAHPNEFKKSNQNDIFISTFLWIHIARAFHLYHLAELCKLNKQEILGGVSDPLLSIITAEDWKTANQVVVVERDLHMNQLDGDEWCFYPSQQRSYSKYNHSKVTLPYVAKQPCQDSITRTTPPKDCLVNWLSSTIATSDAPHLVQTLISAAKVKQQQQAIIETRQRQAAFIIPRIHNKSTNSRRTVVKKSHTTSFPPSPPPTSSINHRKRKAPTVSQQQQQHDDTINKKLKTDVYHHHHQRHVIHHHGNDNLNLLATQATQMLPISPEVSPSPPPHYYGQHRLPSIQSLLSDLHHHHHPPPHHPTNTT